MMLNYLPYYGFTYSGVMLRKITCVNCSVLVFYANLMYLHIFHTLTLSLFDLWSKVKWSRSVMSDSLQPHGL